jgi:hypothetical protein
MPLSRQSRRRRACGHRHVYRVDRTVSVAAPVAVDVNVNITSPCPWPSPRLWLRLWPLLSMPLWPSLCPSPIVPSLCQWPLLLVPLWPSRRLCRRSRRARACGCHLAAVTRSTQKSLKQVGHTAGIGSVVRLARGIPCQAVFFIAYQILLQKLVYLVVVAKLSAAFLNVLNLGIDRHIELQEKDFAQLGFS